VKHNVHKMKIKNDGPNDFAEVHMCGEYMLYILCPYK